MSSNCSLAALAPSLRVVPHTQLEDRLRGKLRTTEQRYKNEHKWILSSRPRHKNGKQVQESCRALLRDDSPCTSVHARSRGWKSSAIVVAMLTACASSPDNAALDYPITTRGHEFASPAHAMDASPVTPSLMAHNFLAAAWSLPALLRGAGDRRTK